MQFLLQQANAIAKTLGGDATFVGMYGAIDVVIMSLRNPPKTAKVNKSELCKPFNEEQVKGPMLLVRMVDGTPKVRSSARSWRVSSFFL